MKSKNKTVITIDQYGLRDLGDGFFNHIQQTASGIMLFKRLVEFKRPVLLMNKSFYALSKDWKSVAKQKLPDVDLTILPVDNSNIDSVVESIKANHDAVIITPIYNLTAENKQKLINDINTAKCYVGSEVKLSVNQKTHKREVSTLDKHVVYKIISGAEYATLDKGTLKFNGAGEVVVLAEYSQILDGVSTFYTEPLKITVYSDAAEAEKNSTQEPTKKNTDGNTMKYVIIAASAVAGVAIIVAVVLIIIKNKNKTNKEGMDNDKTV